MGTLIKQECFKLFKKKSTFIAPIVFILLMVAQGYIATKYNEIFTPQESFTSAYNGFSLRIEISFVVPNTASSNVNVIVY